MIKITRSGAFIKFCDLKLPKNCEDPTLALAKLVKKIKSAFTLSFKDILGNINRVECAKVESEKERMIVPRFGIAYLKSKKYKGGSTVGLRNIEVLNMITSGERPVTPFEWIGKLTENQEIIIESLLFNIYNDSVANAGAAGCILNLEAGQGKSFVAAHLIMRLGVKTAIILHNSSLMGQWEKVLRTTLGENVRIGYLYGNKKMDGDVVLHIINSARKTEMEFSNYGSKVKGENKMAALDYFKRFGFIIYDECHEYTNKTSAKVFKVAQATYMLGLSATPNENTKKFDSVVHWNIGPVIDAAKIDGYSTNAAKFEAVVHRMVYYGPPDYTRLITIESIDVTSVSLTTNMLCKDPYRVSLILDCIDASQKLELYTFVFADRRGYLELLRKCYIDRCENKGENSAIVDCDEDFQRIVSGSSDEDVTNAESKARVIFTTYQYMGTGKSIIKMNGLIFATSRKTKLKQYYNRIFRLGSDQSIKRHIWAIVDAKTVVGKQWASHSKYCKEKNYEVDINKVKYEELDKCDIIPYLNLLDQRKKNIIVNIKTNI
jgi:hypothetical protein